MKHHVFVVGDFISLLEALQARLTCLTMPWRPVGDVEVRRLVNEIVLGEESDLLPQGGSASHFELYLQAMTEAGADTGRIRRFIGLLDAGLSVEAALDQAGVPDAVKGFVGYTFEVIGGGRSPERAARFTSGREGLISQMFPRLCARMGHYFPPRLANTR